ncbi:MFS transporter, partial [bacterium]|nr:MFS transporter [bacterium]
MKLLKMPFKDENYKKLLFFLGSWNFAVNLSAPFFTVYLLTVLKLDMFVVMSLTVLSQIMYFFSLKIWGRLSDHFSNKSVLSLSGPLFIVCILGWTFTTMPDKYWGTMPLLIVLHILMGIATAGVNLSAGNIALKLAPNDKATSYLAVNSFINSIAAGFAPILGGIFADVFARREFSLVINWKSPAREFSINTLNFQYWDFFFIMSFMIGLYSLHRLSRIREVGEVGEKAVINEFFSEILFMMKNLSTTEGLRQMVMFPFSHLKLVTRSIHLRKKNKHNEVKHHH